MSAEETKALESALARMVRGKGIVPSSRREDSRFLVRVRVGGSGGAGDALGLGGGVGSGGLGSELEIADPSQPSSSARVDIRLVDVLEGETLLERGVKCRLPLTQSGRVADPALRANLSLVVDVMEESVQAGPGGRGRETYAVDESVRARLSPAELARALADEADRAARRGDHEAALNLLAEAQPLLKESGHRGEEGLVWERLAGLSSSTGRPVERAVDYAEQAVRRARESSDRRAEARALALLAVMEARASNYPRSLELLQAARLLSRNESDAPTEAAVLANLAALTAVRGSFERARPLLEDAISLLGDAAPRRALARFLLAAALVESPLDARDQARALEQVSRARALGREAGDLSIERDAAFVQAKVRLSTTDLRHLMDGEVDVMRALQLSREIEDRQGEAAAFALLGAFSHRLARPELAAEYLAIAQQQARAGGYVDVVVDGLQLLGDMAPNTERGLSFLDEVVRLRRETGDLRGQVKTLSDMCRLYAALEEEDLARERHFEAVAALQSYVSARMADPFTEDVRGSFLVVLKSLVTTRTELPYLESYLTIRNLTIVPDPTWAEEAK
jgi:tetratricopeptide (TPR) repeat protein